MGAVMAATFADDLLRLSPFSRELRNWSSYEKVMLYGMVILGVAGMFGGLWYISRAISNRRPVLVVDSEGVFYRPYGNAIVPWRDIRAVGEGDKGDHELVLTRQSGRDVSIELMELAPAAGSRGKCAAHRAILEAWEAACARGAGPAAAGCETNTSERKKSLPPANARMRGMAMNDPERKEFFPSPLGIFAIMGLHLLFLAGLACVLAPSLLLLGFRDFPFAALLGKLLSPDSTQNSVLVILTGLAMMAPDLAGLWEGTDRRPVLVVDSEGVFYRHHGDAIIPWRDISALEFDTRNRGDWFSSDGERLFLIRHNGVPVQIQYLGTSAYRAIAQAWERHGRKA